MTEEDKPAVRLQHHTQNEARALLSMYSYYQDEDDDASISVVCLAIINDLGRTQRERACLRRGIEECQLQPTVSKPRAFLAILDHGRKLLAESNEDDEGGPDEAGPYHYIRLMAEFQQRCSAEGQYQLAKEFLEHEQRLRKEEEARQVGVVKAKHERDRSLLVKSHSKQTEEFEETWANFMDDFEQKSQAYIQELEQSHQQQLSSLQESVPESTDKEPKKKWSKELTQYRQRQLLLAEQQRYQEAQQTKMVSDALEAKERANMTSNLDNSLELRERNLKKQHQAETNALTKRLESKRREYTKQRDEDCKRLLQRNQNIQSSFESKHASECAKLASKIEQQVKSMIKEI